MENIDSWQRHCAIASWMRLGALAVIAAAPVLAQFTFTTFDVPAATESVGPPALGTHPYAINNNGDIAGVYDNASGGFSGFIRKADGTFTLFDLSSVNGTVLEVTGINDFNGVAGTGHLKNVAEGPGFVGFVRDGEGNITTFAAQPLIGADNGTHVSQG